MQLPSLIINRFIVKGEGKFLYDELFKKGTNIIRGDNGTGKSTIMDLIYYALGAELTDWTAEERICEETFIEVLINNRMFCLKREIVLNGKAPMFIYEGDSNKALYDSQNWLRYPNKRSSDRHSYSQQLFELMGLPQHKTDDAKNLTMHQILRLIYIDQITQITKLLKSDPIFDNYTIRKAIGEYLLGIDDLEAHNLRQDLILASREYETINGELKAIFKILGKEKSVFRKQELLNEIGEIENEIKNLEEKKHELRNASIDKLDEQIKERISNITTEIQTLSQNKSDLLNKRNLLNSELIDTKLFIESLKFRSTSLEQSKLANIELGEVSFKYCPACLYPINEKSVNSKCELCKTEIDSSERHYSYIQMANEINFQLKESENLINQFHNEIDEINIKLPSINRNIEILKNEYKELTENVDKIDAALSDISSEIGLNRGKIINLNEKIELANQIKDLNEHRDKILIRISEIKQKLSLTEAETEDRYNSVYKNIETIVIDLLKQDGGYEEEFKNPEYITFDFGHDKMTVNGRSKFSASSMVVMKNSIRLGIFIHCIEDIKTRIPRLLLFDNIEDKGMMPARSQNYQKAIVKIFSNKNGDYQLIFTTSMIDQELNNSNLVVGPYYKKGMHTLVFGEKQSNNSQSSNIY